VVKGVYKFMRGFRQIFDIPNIIGALDGTHIILANAPGKDPEAFFNRKKQYSIQCQAFVDAEGVFTDFLVGWPGSVHDARVYRSSGFYQNKSDYIVGEDFILADSAYPISPFCITPFKPARTPSEHNFNFVHSRNRVVVENAFGRLKGRFPSLRNLSIKKVSTACKMTACAIILHNFLEMQGDAFTELFSEENSDNDAEVSHYDLQNDEEAMLKLAGEEKRRHLMNFISQ
jgi:hypothetical protein